MSSNATNIPDTVSIDVCGTMSCMRFFSLISLSSVMVFAVMVGTIISYAHTTGATIEQRINGYLIDIGYSAERIAVNTTARFDFLLFDE